MPFSLCMGVVVPSRLCPGSCPAVQRKGDRSQQLTHVVPVIVAELLIFTLVSLCILVLPVAYLPKSLCVALHCPLSLFVSIFCENSSRILFFATTVLPSPSLPPCFLFSQRHSLSFSDLFFFFAISVLRCHSTCTMSAAAAVWNNMRSTVAGNITVSTSRSARLRLVISCQLPFFLAFFFLDHNTTCIYVGLLNIEMCAKWRVPHDWSLQIR